MENLKNKSQSINSKDYFERFIKLNIYSYTRPDDKKINIGAKPDEVYSLFNGNTSSIKKEINNNINYIRDKDNINIDQSVLQYYIILALQDFYNNYYKPLSEENTILKANIDELKSAIKDIKHKNDQRFEYIVNKLKLNNKDKIN